MKYSRVVNGQFVRRINRFLAEVMINNKKEVVHIKNTGRLTELFQPNADVRLEVSDNPKRKTKYSLIAARKKDIWVNIDSQAPNKVAFEALKNGDVKELPTIIDLRREVTYGESRFDIYYETEEGNGFIEVKGVTLEQNGVAMFPDAPTKRGTKHVYELIKARQEGYMAAILFVIQMKGCQAFTPHKEMDEEFAHAIVKASQSGVRILAYDSIVKENELILDQLIAVRLFE